MLKLVTVRVGMVENGILIHTIWTSVWNGCLDYRFPVRGEAVEELADYCFFFLGRPKQNRPDSLCYCADVEVTAICCKGKRRRACQFGGVADRKMVNWDMQDDVKEELRIGRLRRGASCQGWFLKFFDLMHRL